MPGAEQGAGVRGGGPRGVLAEITLLGMRFSPQNSPNPSSATSAHVASCVIDSPQLERETGAKRVSRGESSLSRGAERCQPSAPVPGAPGRARTGTIPRSVWGSARVPERLSTRASAADSTVGRGRSGRIFVESCSGQSGEAEFAQDLTSRGCAQRGALLFERFGDLVDGVIASCAGARWWRARRTSSAGSADPASG